jgi:hypothetical protein
MRSFLRHLTAEFEFVETPENPDYIFTSNLDRFALKYSGVRIWLTGECLIPDFNLMDYAIGPSDIQFGDRYLRWPLYRWNLSFQECEALRREALSMSPVHQRNLFCACVISNLSNRQGPLVEVCDALERYHGLTYGGKWRNNIGGRVRDKQELLQRHKFSLAFENSAYPGYVTEKILDAFLAGTVPIYWGDPTITQQFNPKAFIHCLDGEPIDELLRRVQKVNESQEAYEAMTREPIFSETTHHVLSHERFVGFLKNIFSQPLEQAFRRNRSRWGIKYEQTIQMMYFQPFRHLL